MPKRTDENETAFSGPQEIIRRDAERDGFSYDAPPAPTRSPAKVKAGQFSGHKTALHAPKSYRANSGV